MKGAGKKGRSGPLRPSLPAKLTRPQAHAIVPRERICQRLEAPDLRWTWLAAPAGAGKTTLASSWIEAQGLACLWVSLDAGDADPATLFHYLNLAAAQRAGPKDVGPPPLTPEFLPRLAIYARRFFEYLFGLYREPFAMVVDNCHEVPAQAPFSGVILPALIESLPEHGRLLCLSRGTLPPALARWSVDPRFQMLGWEDMSFTDEEAKELAALVAPDCAIDVGACNQRVNGWVTGLKLLLRAGPEQIARLKGQAFTAPQALFDYFAEEVFRRVPRECAEFLLNSCVLAEMDGPTAVVVGGRDDAATVLAHLYEERLFIQRRLLPSGPSYRFHRLFREFLLARLEQERGEAAVAQLKRRAALALEECGQLEAATLLALDCGDAALLSRLILAQAPLFAGVGRLPTLARWLDAVPESVRLEQGWLSYWSGVANSVSDEPLGRAHLEQAYERFRACGDQKGTWLAVAGIIGNLFLSWGSAVAEQRRWISAFETLRAENGGIIPEDVEPQILGALCHMAGLCPELALSRHLAQRARTLAPIVADADQCYAIGAAAIGHLVWQGDEASAWALVEDLERTRAEQTRASMASASFDAWRAILLWNRCEHEKCFALLRSARERYLRAGLGFFEIICAIHLPICALSSGDVELAGRFLQEFPRFPGQFVGARQFFLAVKVMHLALAGQRAEAVALGREVIATGNWQDMPSHAACDHTCLAVGLLEAGALEEASACAEHALERAGHLPSDRWVFDSQMVRAGIELERGSEQRALARLQEALSLAARRDFRGGVSLFPRLRTARLLALALGAGIEPEYVGRLIRTRKLAPPQLRSGVDWPVRLRIQVLGHFALSIDGQAPKQAVGAAHKPLEVLKALIGLGPSEVSLGTLEAAVWPDLEGDAARNACHVAMHRLRKVLGDESAIEIDHGVASLNMTDAWVDVEAFRALALQVRSASSNRVCSRSQAEEMASELMAVYPGHFLPGDEQPWAVGVRAQLRSRFVQVATELSQALERGGALQAAVELNRHGIALDPHAESFHNGLMRALIALGRKCEAQDAFERCRELLRTGLGTQPSAETRNLQFRIDSL